MELPLKEIVFEPGKNAAFGLFAMAVVQNPALKEDYVFFGEQSKVNFSVNDEQRIIFGPALIPNIEVYRNQNGEEYNLTVSRDTIEKIAIDFAENNRLNNVNEDHVDEVTPGIVIFQSIITNEHTIPSIKGWEHLPVGTLFYGAKVKNDEAWAAIKEGKYKGWSIHGYFEQAKLTMSSNDNEDIESILNEIINN